MIHKIWLQQPMAFARVGGSTTPLSPFAWTEADLRPRGRGRTSIAVAQGFDVDPETGEIAAVPFDPDAAIVFKDAEGLRPVCPFFELHGEWDGAAGPITLDVLNAAGKSLSDVSWRIDHANLKAHYLTRAEGDRIAATLTVPGDHHGREPLMGASPADADQPLVPSASPILMGHVQAVRPSAALPEIRFRFYAPPGDAYAPRNLAERTRRRNGWSDSTIPADRRTLNPEAEWAKHTLYDLPDLAGILWRAILNARSVGRMAMGRGQLSEIVRLLLPPTTSVGKLPPGLFASTLDWLPPRFRSLGIVDDMGDGIITCRINGIAQLAQARIVVSPPDFAPDRRTPLSLADGLADRTERATVRAPDWSRGDNWTLAQDEIHDLLERAFETAGLLNVDVWNRYFRGENSNSAGYRSDEYDRFDSASRAQVDSPADHLWPEIIEDSVDPLPFTERVRRRHRRNAAREAFEQIVRERPDLLKELVREPHSDGSTFYDKKMPALMRGSDRRPLHLTRRQYEALKVWATTLKEPHD